jgi:N-glycosylase/DNA lyase
VNETAIRLDRAVRSLCPDIAERVEHKTKNRLTEVGLWRELTCCVLSSQVSYQIALSATSRLNQLGVFSRISGRESTAVLYREIYNALNNPLNVDGKRVRYRFPSLRARQICATRDALETDDLFLSTLVYRNETDLEKRRQLISTVFGFGPKQTSMFLRNVSESYGLAILDRHALRFMNILGLVADREASVSATLRQYELIEFRFSKYASRIGYPTGYVDWAVWIVMRAFGSLEKS